VLHDDVPQQWQGRAVSYLIEAVCHHPPALSCTKKMMQHVTGGDVQP
jgi:hypothetical protein